MNSLPLVCRTMTCLLLIAVLPAPGGCLAQSTLLENVPGWDRQDYQSFVDESRWPSQHPQFLNLLAYISNISPRAWRESLGDTEGGDTEGARLSGESELSDLSVGRAVAVHGQALKTRRVKLSGVNSENVGAEHYFVTQLQSVEGGHIEVVSRQVPLAWATRDAPLEQPVIATGILLKWIVLPDGQSRVPLILAERLSWYPDEAIGDWGIGPSQIALTEAGVDFSLRQHLVFGSQQPLTTEESRLVFQLFQARQRQPEIPKWQPADVAEWLRQATRSNARHLFGNAYRFRGRVRRVTRVETTNQRLLEEFGTDAYYQLEVFVDSRPIRMVDRSGKPILDEQGKPFVYGSEYAVTVLTPDLPELLSPIAGRSRELAQSMSFSAVFLKTWNHHSFKTRTSRSAVIKTTPILVALAIEPIESTGRGWFWISLPLVSVLVLFGILAVYLRRQGVRSRVRGLPEKIEWPPDNRSS